jgi:hypothetical protein
LGDKGKAPAQGAPSALGKYLDVKAHVTGTHYHAPAIAIAIAIDISDLAWRPPIPNSVAKRPQRLEMSR